jgi:hypothetical protein
MYFKKNNGANLKHQESEDIFIWNVFENFLKLLLCKLYNLFLTYSRDTYFDISNNWALI